MPWYCTYVPGRVFMHSNIDAEGPVRHASSEPSAKVPLGQYCLVAVTPLHCWMVEAPATRLNNTQSLVFNVKLMILTLTIHTHKSMCTQSVSDSALGSKSSVVMLGICTTRVLHVYLRHRFCWAGVAALSATFVLESTRGAEQARI